MSNALDKWMLANKISNVKLAELLKDYGIPTTRQHVRYMRTGERRPSPKMSGALWEITKHKVSANDFMDFTGKARPRKAKAHPKVAVMA